VIVSQSGFSESEKSKGKVQEVAVRQMQASPFWVEGSWLLFYGWEINIFLNS